MGTKLKVFFAIATIALGGTAAASAWRSAAFYPAQAQAQEEAEARLRSWNVASITVHDQTLIVQMDEGHVTEELYLSVMTDGLCPNVLGDSSLSSLSEIQVLNRKGGRGYVYQSGLSGCSEYFLRPVGDDETTFDILSATRMQAPSGVGL